MSSEISAYRHEHLSKTQAPLICHNAQNISNNHEEHHPRGARDRPIRQRPRSELVKLHQRLDLPIVTEPFMWMEATFESALGDLPDIGCEWSIHYRRLDALGNGNNQSSVLYMTATVPEFNNPKNMRGTSPAKLGVKLIKLRIWIHSGELFSGLLLLGSRKDCDTACS